MDRTASSQFTPTQFAAIAQLNPNLRIAQIRGVVIPPDGGQITLLTTASGERIADKRALTPYDGDGHLLDTYAAEGGMRLVSGTPGIAVNPDFGSVETGLKALMKREGRAVVVCSQPQGGTAYYLYAAGQQQPLALGVKGLDFAQVAYMPKPQGFVARRKGSNQLWFLPFAAGVAGQGNLPNAWNPSNELTGADAITALPARIVNASVALCQTIEGGQRCADTLDLSKIDRGQIVSVAREIGINDVAFRCFAGEGVAIVETGQNARDLQGGVTYQVPTSKIAEFFGKAGTEAAPTAV